MKTKRRGVLFTALTLVLGFALLTTTIAAPQLRLVYFAKPGEVLAQSMTTAALGAQEGRTQQSMKSPAFIPLEPQADLALTGFEVREYDKTAGVPNDATPPAPGTKLWGTHVELLDIFSSRFRDPARVRQAEATDTGLLHDLYEYDSDPDNKIGGIIVPGDAGRYRFVLDNLNDFPVSYSLGVDVGDQINLDDDPFNFFRQFNVVYSLHNVTTDDWLSGVDPDPDREFDDLVSDVDTSSSAQDVSLTANSKHIFDLHWKWEYDVDAGQDAQDTELGDQVKAYFEALNTINEMGEEELPLYQIKLIVALEAGNFQVNFNPSDGDMPAGFPDPAAWVYTRPGTYGQPLGEAATIELPVPERAGFNFLGWFRVEDGTAPGPGDAVTKTTALPVGGSDEITIYAHWEAISGNTVIVTLDPGDGTLPLPAYNPGDTKALTYTVEPGKKLGAAPGPLADFEPEYPGYVFTGWTDKNDNNKKYTDASDLPAGNITLTATWKKIITVTFDPKGGTFDNPLTDSEWEYLEGDKYGTPYGVAPLKLPQPRKVEPYQFVHWYKELLIGAGPNGEDVFSGIVTEEDLVRDKDLLYEDHTLYARYVYRVYYNPGEGATIGDPKYTDYDTDDQDVLHPNPTNDPNKDPKKPGYKFEKWVYYPRGYDANGNPIGEPEDFIPGKTKVSDVNGSLIAVYSPAQVRNFPWWTLLFIPLPLLALPLLPIGAAIMAIPLVLGIPIAAAIPIIGGLLLLPLVPILSIIPAAITGVLAGGLTGVATGVLSGIFDREVEVADAKCDKCGKIEKDCVCKAEIKDKDDTKPKDKDDEEKKADKDSGKKVPAPKTGDFTWPMFGLAAVMLLSIWAAFTMFFKKRRSES